METKNRLNIEKKNAFYREICEIKKTLIVKRENSFSDKHSIFTRPKGLFGWLFGEHVCDLNFRYDFTVEVLCKDYKFAGYCETLSKVLDDAGVPSFVSDDTVTKKETC